MLPASPIRSRVLFSIFSVPLLTAEGLRQVRWPDNRDDQTPAHEARWVVYRLFGRWTVWTAALQTEPFENPDSSLAYGVEHRPCLDEKFGHPLCQVGLETVSVARFPGVIDGMCLEELQAAGVEV